MKHQTRLCYGLQEIENEKSLDLLWRQSLRPFFYGGTRNEINDNNIKICLFSLEFEYIGYVHFVSESNTLRGSSFWKDFLLVNLNNRKPFLGLQPRMAKCYKTHEFIWTGRSSRARVTKKRERKWTDFGKLNLCPSRVCYFKSLTMLELSEIHFIIPSVNAQIFQVIASDENIASPPVRATCPIHLILYLVY
jgi:hypothetical protein